MSRRKADNLCEVHGCKREGETMVLCCKPPNKFCDKHYIDHCEDLDQSRQDAAEAAAEELEAREEDANELDTPMDGNPRRDTRTYDERDEPGEVWEPHRED